MPGFDQTGPVGQGSMTGRRMGRCTNYGAATKDQPMGEGPNANFPENFRRGFGRRPMGRGRGLGMQNRFRGGF
ncbi:MAG: DUF5320 domain-containing protein [Bacteroidales bacterium]